MAAATAAAAVTRRGALLLSPSIRTTSRVSRRTFIPTAGTTLSSAIRSSIAGNNRSLLSIFPFPSSFSSSRRFCSCSSPQLSTAPTGEALPASAAEDNSENAPLVPASPATPSDPIKEAADALDIRVGRIVKVWRHPEADSLYVEEVDVGEAEPRTICSGLVNYIPIEHLQVIQLPKNSIEPHLSFSCLFC